MSDLRWEPIPEEEMLLEALLGNWQNGSMNGRLDKNLIVKFTEVGNHTVDNCTVHI